MSDQKAKPTTKKIPQINFLNKKKATEVWVYIGAFFALMMAVFWGVVFLRLGHRSIFVHATLIPTLGAMTIPLMAWGVMRTLMYPPAFRKPRTAGFALTLFVGFAGMVPFISVPLSTENWIQDFEVELPFKGKWYTQAGGDDPVYNYHTTTAAQRWAYDFTIQKDGKTFTLDGKTNEDYYCFGQDILAPVDGKITQVLRSDPDNNIGEIASTPEKAPGNFVVIRINPEAYVFLQHLKHDSLKVEIGDDVRKGQVIAQCGNSGRSYEPHLQIHAQNSEEFPISESLPFTFNGIDHMPRGESGWNAGDGETVSGE